MSAPHRPSRARPIVGGTAIVLLGALIALGALNVVNRADGDLLAELPLNRGAHAPAWALIAILVVVGTLIAVCGIALATSSYKSLSAAKKAAEQQVQDRRTIPDTRQ